MCHPAAVTVTKVPQGTDLLGGVSSEKNDTPLKASAAAMQFCGWLTPPPKVKIKQHHQTQIETVVPAAAAPYLVTFSWTPPLKVRQKRGPPPRRPSFFETRGVGV